jgi:hypothetical protein
VLLNERHDTVGGERYIGRLVGVVVFIVYDGRRAILDDAAQPRSSLYPRLSGLCARCMR